MYMLHMSGVLLGNDIFMKNIYDTKEKSDSNGGMTLEEARENYKNYGACDKNL